MKRNPEQSECLWQPLRHFPSLWICQLWTFHKRNHTICGFLCLAFRLGIMFLQRGTMFFPLYGGIILRVSVCAQLCPTLCNPMGCSPPGCSVHGISQARILEWVAISSSGGSSQPRDQTHVSCASCIVSRLFATKPPGKPPCYTIASFKSGFARYQ